MRRPVIVALLMLASSLLPLSEQLLGQEQSAQKITFHVTAVRLEEMRDSCPSDVCSATKFTVEGYSDVKGDSHSTEYVLECDEILAYKPSPHVTVQCVRLHANHDYEASLWSASIAFSTTSPSKDAIVANYNIVSEKEDNKQKR
jgi:hypothetical protein